MAVQAEKGLGLTFTPLILLTLLVFKLARRAAMAQSASSGPVIRGCSLQQIQETCNDDVY
jgi:hypothetical protein